MRKPTDDQMHALQEQRHREALAVELAALRAHEERARWCEEMGADVRWNPVRKLWVPQWWKDGVLNQVSHPDRNAAIDLARGAA